MTAAGRARCGVLLVAALAAPVAVDARQEPDLERRAAQAVAALERDPTQVEPVLALLREAPRHVPLHRALVAAAERQQDWLRALRGRREIEELAGPSPDDQLAATVDAVAAGAYDLARCQVGAALRARPDDAAAWLLAARVEVDAGRFEAAHDALERAFALGEASAEGFLLRGEVLYRLMRVPEAVSAFAMALARDPGAAERVASFALSGALAAAAPAGAAHPSPHTDVGLAELRPVLERHAEADPARVNTRYALGVMAMRDGRAADARRWLEPLAARLDQPPIHYNLALAHRALGDDEAARRSFARFAALEAEEARRWEERNRVDRLRGQAAAAREAGELEEALDRWQQADAAGVLSVDDLVGWGETLLEVGRPAESARVLDRALAGRPADRAAIAARRRAAESAGDARSVRAFAARAALLEAASWRCGAPPASQGSPPAL